MLTDISACEVSLTQQDSLSAWNNVILGVLSHGQSTGDHLTTLLRLEPNFAMGHALKGLSCLMLGRRELVAAAQAASNDAEQALTLGGATARERLWCEALTDWLAGRPSRSIVRMEAALKLNPADTISMKLSHGIRFMLGDYQGMLRSVERVISAHGVAHPLYGYALGCHAFALEENGRYAKAESVGLRGLDFAKDDAWGLHAVAHVYEMTHQTQRGISLIDENHSAWDHCNNFRFHVWWHKALMHLDEGEIGTVLRLYDTKVRDEKTDDYRDFANASSLLMRLELEGVDVGDRWTELADLAEKRSDDGCLTFADLHYMLALVGETRPDAVIRLSAQVAQNATKADEMAGVMRTPGVSTAQGLAAFGEGNFETAFSYLRTAHSNFQDMGGSHAQRDVFERLTIEAGLRAGRLAETELLLRGRTAMRAGHEDAFAASRMAQISNLRAMTVPSTAAN
ncbi:tetratricopeptide repeat protein [Shimia sp. MMG029]|uniref:tetratricopeptide repeat protein n=1 Tax=Shimia sp. MMG029 TaxID=3021978 RepID=UPI0022FDE99C|nr:tetratricopeptide repeat protein [Shimia sp. MMG029]MDA5559028.1 tetratricopeptide repeat protein [Shimia sp. MMG029]